MFDKESKTLAEFNKELLWLLLLDAVIVAVTAAAACVGYMIWRVFLPIVEISVGGLLLCCLIAPVVYLLCYRYLKSKRRIGIHKAALFLLRLINSVFICIFSVYFYFGFQVVVFHLIW